MNQSVTSLPLKAEKFIVVYVGNQAKQVAQLETNLYNTKVNSEHEKVVLFHQYDEKQIAKASNSNKPIHLSLSSINKEELQHLASLKSNGYIVNVNDLSTPNELRNTNHILRLAALNNPAHKNLSILKNEIANSYNQAITPKPHSKYDGLILCVDERLATQKTSDNQYILHDSKALSMRVSDQHHNLSISYGNDLHQVKIKGLRATALQVNQPNKANENDLSNSFNP